MVKRAAIAPAVDHVPGTWRLLYFDAPNRGEQVRVLFFLAGVSFDDVRLKYPEGLSPYTKAALGEASPLLGTDMCPAVTAPDGTHCVETADIMRFVGKRVGLAPASEAQEELAMTRCLMAQEILNEVFYKLLKPMTVQHIARTDLCCLLRPLFTGLLGGGAATTHRPVAFLRAKLPVLEEALTGSGGPYFSGASLTYESVALFAVLREALAFSCFAGATELAAYPNLAEFMDLMEHKASGWIERRVREHQLGYANTVEYFAVTNSPFRRSGAKDTDGAVRKSS